MARRRIDTRDEAAAARLEADLLARLRADPDDVEAARELDQMGSLELMVLRMRDERVNATLRGIWYPPDPDAPPAPVDLNLVRTRTENA